MVMLGVVPREEGSTEGEGGRPVREAPGEPGVVLQGLERCLREGVVVADLGAAERAGDAELGEELRGARAGHGGAAVRVQGPHPGLDPLLETRLLDPPAGQGRALALGDPPSHPVAAEEIKQHVEVEGRPGLRPKQPCEVPGPDRVRGAGDEFGLGVAWVGARVAPFPHRLPDGEDAVPRALRAQVPPFVEQRSHDLGRGTTDETRGGEPVEDLLPLPLAPGPGGRRTGLRMPGSGPPAAGERGPGHPQRPTGRRHADRPSEGSGGHPQSFPSRRLNPSSPATFPWTSRIVGAVASSFSSRATWASSRRTWAPRGGDGAGLGPRLRGVRPCSAPRRRALRHVDRCERYSPSRRSRRPISPGSRPRSASSTIRSRYSAENRRRVGWARTSGSGARRAGGVSALGGAPPKAGGARGYTPLPTFGSAFIMVPLCRPLIRACPKTPKSLIT